LLATIVRVADERPVGSKLVGVAKLWLHVRLDVEIFVRIEKDVSFELVFTLHYVCGIQLQFDVGVHLACTSPQTLATAFKNRVHNILYV